MVHQLLRNVTICLLLSVFAKATLSEEVEHDGIHWHDLAVVSSSTDTILLHPSRGHVAKGHICGIIGSSGAGKSTFLSALGGATSQHARLELSGRVWYHEQNLDSILNIRDGQVAFLQQHDAFFSMLTTRETLDLAAFLEFPTLSNPQRHALVERSLDVLGLKAVQHRPIGARSSTRRSTHGLSGGEKRRLSVALELLTTPQLFLADEPTTGLDSSQAHKVVLLLKQLAKDRHIPCLCSLHQPRASIWKLLDDVIVMASGGRVCYMGPRNEATRYFDKLGYACPPETNPAEFLIDLVSIDTEDPAQAEQDEARIQTLAAAFAKENVAKQPPPRYHHDMQQIVTVSSLGGSIKDPNRRRRGQFLRPVLWLRRSAALLQRSWRQNVRNHRVNLLRLVAAVGNALLFSQIFPNVRRGVPTAKSIADRTALLTFGVVNMSMLALMKTINLFAKERPVVDREQVRRQYTGLEYLCSKALAEIPLDAAFSAVFTAVLKATTGLRISMLQLTGTFSLLTVSAAALGFLVGSITSSGESATATGMPLLVILMVVGIINPSGVDKSRPPSQLVQWLKWASPIRCAIEALCVAEYRGMEFEDASARFAWQKLRNLPRLGAFVMVRNGEQVLDALALEDAAYDKIMSHLALLSGINLFLSWVGLHFGGATFITPSTNDSVLENDSSAEEALTVPLVRKF